MNVRHLIAALTVPCACAAAERAVGQDRSVYGPVEPGATAPLTAPPAADPRAPRAPVLPREPRGAKVTMIENWQVGDRAEVGLGRFQVGEIARARTNTERVRDDLMARENRSIAGAGVRIRFD